MSALLEQVRIDRIKVSQAAGTSDITSDAVDMSVDGGYRGCLFNVHFGDATSGHVTKIKVQGSSDDSSYSDLTGTLSTALGDTSGDKLLVVDIYRPAHRYLKLVVDRGTQNVEIDTIEAILYENNTEKTAQSSDVDSSEIHISPAAGTA